MIDSIKEAEQAIRVIFRQEFPAWNFDEWNQSLDDTTAANIIKAVGSASRINVKKFIEDLW